ncbi:hypothetical protein HYW21_01890 [Candidatus Woesearchaeota archaeon]|nr:hypothetical protein [Candidatus Woesearchaeota archaeon]
MVPLFTITHYHQPGLEWEYNGSLEEYHLPGVTLERVASSLQEDGDKIIALDQGRLDHSRIDHWVTQVHSPLYWESIKSLARFARVLSEVDGRDVYLNAGVHNLRSVHRWQRDQRRKLVHNTGVLERIASGDMSQVKDEASQVVTDLVDYVLGDNYTKIGELTLTSLRESIGATLAAVDDIFQERSSLNHALPIAGHHAGYDLASGYCFVNNTVIAAVYALAQHLNPRQDGSVVLIYDIDNHFGNGFTSISKKHSRLPTTTSHFILNDIVYVSQHADTFNHFPRVGGSRSDPGRNIFNVPLPHGTEGEEYVRRAREVLTDVKERYGDRVRYLIVGFGTDAHKDDAIGKLKLDDQTYSHLGMLIKELFPHVPISVIQEGGYNADSAGRLTTNFSRALR